MPNSSRNHNMRAARNHLQDAQDAAEDGAAILGDGLRSAASRGQAAGESLREAAGNVAEAAGDRLDEVREGLTELGHVARDTVYASAEELRKRAELALEAGRARLHDVSNTIEGRIRAMPMRSVAIAAGVGLAIGLLLRRRS